MDLVQCPITLSKTQRDMPGLEIILIWMESVYIGQKEWCYYILFGCLKCDCCCFSNNFSCRNILKWYFFYFLKIIFEISTSKRSKTYKKKLIFYKKKIKNFWERGLHRIPKRTRMSSKNHGQYGKTLNTVQSICLLEIVFV